MSKLNCVFKDFYGMHKCSSFHPFDQRRKLVSEEFLSLKNRDVFVCCTYVVLTETRRGRKSSVAGVTGSSELPMSARNHQQELLMDEPYLWLLSYTTKQCCFT